MWDKIRLQKRDFADSMIDPNHSPFDYVPAKLRIDGLEVPKVSARKKGFLGSLDDDYPSLIIKLDDQGEASPLAPLKRLTLNNNKQDLSLLSQRMAYDFFNQVGVPAPRVGFASVHVNGKHLGLYSMIEPVDRLFLERNFGDGSGDLLEGTLSDFSEKSIPRMELKSGKSKSSKEWRVNQVAQILEEEPHALERLESLLDLQRFYRYWASESLLAFWDGYCANQNNYFVYDDPRSGRLQFLPWGADSLWSSMGGPFGGFGKTTQSVYANAVLPHALFRSDEGRTLYRRTLSELLDKHWDEDKLISEIDQLSTLIAPHLHPRQKGATQAQNEMKRFIKNRRQRVVSELDAWPVSIPEKPRKPTYTEVVGSVSADFQTFWQRSPKNQEPSIQLTLLIDNETIELRDTKVIAKRFSMEWMSFGAPANTLPPMLEITGTNPAGESYVLNITFESSDFVDGVEGGKKRVGIRGSFNKVEQRGGGGWPMGGPNMRFLQGTCTLSKASTTNEGPVIGSFEAKIIRIVGGFFGG